MCIRDRFFISGCTMVERDIVKAAKEAGKKIVLRVDNIPRNSRNRNTGTSRLYDYAQMADLVVYQSQWARNFIGNFIKRNGSVILNGVDTNIFKPKGPKIAKEGNKQYLYVRYNRDENKRWEEAWFFFQDLILDFNPKAHLWIVGKFSPEQIEYNFDFFGGAEKRFKYWGVIESPEMMAQLYRGADYLLCPYYNDACSNVVAEAQACGLEICHNGTGGIPEQIKAGVISNEEMGQRYLEEFKKLL